MKPGKVYDRNISFNRAFVDLGIGITGALLLSQAVYWSRRTKDVDGWFFKSGRDWEDETGLTRHEQETARRRLIDLGLLEESKRGVPCTVHFRVRADVLDSMIHGGQASLFVEDNPVCGKPANWIAGNQQTGLRKSRKPVCGEPASKPAGNPPTITETTNKETTAKSSSRADGAPISWVTAEHMVATCPGLTNEAAADYLNHRRSLKKGVLSDRAWRDIAKEIEKSGWPPDDAVSRAMSRGWVGLQADWLTREERGHAKPSGTPVGSSRGTIADRARVANNVAPAGRVIENG